MQRPWCIYHTTVGLEDSVRATVAPEGYEAEADMIGAPSVLVAVEIVVAVAVAGTGAMLVAVAE
jgi:hypothetical protein